MKCRPDAPNAGPVKSTLEAWAPSYRVNTQSGERAKAAMSHDIQTMASQALKDLEKVFAALASDTGERLCAEIVRARRIACYGVGREGLMMKALCMRLMHLGLDAHVVGDMTVPPISSGDLLLASAGPGEFSTVLALMRVAHGAGARTLVVTAEPQGLAAREADVVIHLPAQTMAHD